MGSMGSRFSGGSIVTVVEIWVVVRTQGARDDWRARPTRPSGNTSLVWFGGRRRGHKSYRVGRRQDLHDLGDCLKRVLGLGQRRRVNPERLFLFKNRS